MTTIAYKSGVMAADSGTWLSNVAYRTGNKLAVGPDGSLHGVTGNAADGCTYLRWVTDGMKGDAPKPTETDPKEGRSSFMALVVLPDRVRLWTAHGFEEHERPAHFAIGAGSEMAIGAMAAGATAEEAIAIVADNSEYARLPVRTIIKHGGGSSD